MFSLHFNFHSRLHRQSKVRPFEMDGSIAFMYPGNAARKFAGLSSSAEIKAIILVHAQWETKEESSVLCNGHLPGMKTMNTFFFLFFSKAASSQRHRCEKGKTFHIHPRSLLYQHKEYTHRGGHHEKCMLSWFSWGRTVRANPLFLLTLAFIAHPRRGHRQIATAG